MDKMTGKEKRDWTFMSENPPTDEWGEARMQRLLDLGAGSAKWYGAGDQVDNVVQNVILRMIKNHTWWNDPKNQIGNPAAFKGYMYASFRNETRSLHEGDKRFRKNSIIFSALFARQGYEGAVRSSVEPTDPRPKVNPEEVAIQNEERLHVRTELSRILLEFAGTLDNTNKVTYEIFKEQARVSESSREREKKTVEYILHVVGLLSPPRNPHKHGLERTGELIKAYMATDPSLKSGTARKRIARLRSAFRPFKEQVAVVYNNLRN